MFEKFDSYLFDFLDENSSEDFWYDYAFMQAQELLANFTDEDWEKLAYNLKDKSDVYKIRLVYCIDEDNGMNGFNLLLDLLNENNKVVEYVIDSLRSFNSERYKKLINSNKQIKDKVEALLKNASLPIKMILEAFLKQNK
ncbi:hypothetical protein [Neisseria sp. Ec49-e6-T10]|uniref:hypothetical protein n=1 Tax=Neisseria sp. Ec49-e6-T10 TaxID=3140744 RepID=UPI003EC00853